MVPVDETPSHVAIVEYIGQHVKGVPNGLGKDNTVSEVCIRMQAETMEVISSMTKHQSAKEVYDKLTADLHMDAVLQNAAIVHDRKYREARKDRQNNSTHHH